MASVPRSRFLFIKEASSCDLEKKVLLVDNSNLVIFKQKQNVGLLSHCRCYQLGAVIDGM